MTNQDIAASAATGAGDEPWRDWLEALTTPAGPVVSVKRRRRLEWPGGDEGDATSDDDPSATGDGPVDRATRVFRLCGSAPGAQGADDDHPDSASTEEAARVQRPTSLAAPLGERRSTRVRRRPSHRPGAVTRTVFPPATPRPVEAPAAPMRRADAAGVGHGDHAVTMRALDALRATLAEIRALAGFRLD